jgi:multidrug transporter EmrE-like cation transporter
VQKNFFWGNNHTLKVLRYCMSLVEIIGLSLIEIVGDFSLKQYANGGGIVHLITGIMGYVGVVIMLIITLKGSTVLLVNAAWDGMSALTGSLAAFIILGERFDHYSQYLGAVLIIAGLYLLKIPITRKNIF